MKRLPIGISDFRNLIELDYFFVDKTNLISEIYRESAATILITRPRRFGKTLNMSMLNYFYDNSLRTETLFKNFNVNKDKEIMDNINGYPTIFISFKDIKNNNWNSAFENIKLSISKLYISKEKVLEGIFSDENKREYFKKITNRSASDIDFQNSLLNLTDYLYNLYGKPVLLLIDEYDVPIQSGWTHGYYDDVIDFMRIFLSAALKDNSNLFKGVLTGIYRVAKESIFSGLNNLSVFTILEKDYSEYFGFTEAEIELILNELGKNEDENIKNGLREWYNGYSFGGNTIYNPWSIINYLRYEDLKAYWINTSSNDLIIRLVEENLKRRDSFREEIETIISGNPLEKYIDDSSALREIEKIPNAIWSLFLFSGYLKPENVNLERGKYRCELKIPNEEVNIFFQDTVINWLNCADYDEKFTYMSKALISGDGETFCIKLKDFVQSTLSYYDIEKVPENTYHILLLGIFAQLQERYYVKSNRESGKGRYDILLKSKDKKDFSIILEIKNGIENLNKALIQIEERDYTRELVQEGYTNILKVAIGVDGKNVETMLG